jgi:hypothetical protein
MWVEQVPVDWLMSKYLFGFSPNAPAPEDAPVRAYLAEHKLQPRWRGLEDYDGELYEVWCFGECYLGPHLYAIADLQRQYAEPAAVE